jgi:DinB family protein
VSRTAADFSLSLVRELEGFKRELALFPDDESVWTTLPGVTNSAGNLALHVAGNLQHFIGTVLGGTGYVRNRELEFNQRSGPRENIYAELDAAIAVIRKVLPGLSDAALDQDFPEAVMGSRFRTGTFLVHLCSHAGFHLGQAGYLRRIITRDSTSSGPLPLGPLASRT